MAWIGCTRVVVWLLPLGVPGVGVDGYTLIPLAAGGGGHRGWYTAAPARPCVAILIHAIDTTDPSCFQGVP